MLDLGHIHDILGDAKDDDHYSHEARESARILVDALNRLWEDGVKQGRLDAKEEGA